MWQAQTYTKRVTLGFWRAAPTRGIRVDTFDDSAEHRQTGLGALVFGARFGTR